MFYSTSDDNIALQPVALPTTSSTASLSMFNYQGRNPHSGGRRVALGSRRTRQLLISYGPDWIITIVLAAAFLALDTVSGFKRDFSLDDTSLRHTYAVHERVPDFALYMICGVAPLILQPTINYFTIRSWWDLHNSTLGLILGLALTGAITEVTKITVGRPRPDLIARCIPALDSVDPKWGLSTAAICTQTDRYILNDGWRSFPSGHSSLSFAGLGFLSFYLAGKVHLFDNRGYAPKAWLALTPLAGATLVAISRTMDYRHHWQDVLTGSVLGLVLAYFSYRQYYPSLASETSHCPYSPRIKHEDSILPLHHVHSTETHGTANGQSHYRDSVEDGDALARETVPRPERTHMLDVWKDDDEEEAIINGEPQSHH